MATVSSEPHIVSAANEFRLTDMPADGVSCVSFSADRTARLLLAASWDCSVRLYDVASAANNSMRVSYKHAAPVLCCAFMDPVRCISSGLDCAVKMFDLNTNTEMLMGSHDKPVRCARQCADLNLAVTGGWDACVKLWDPRTRAAASAHQQPDRVYAMAVAGSRLIVGTAGRKVCIWDLRQMAVPEVKKESSLKYQTRAISAFPSNDAYVLGSIEGRVAVEYINQDPEAQKRKYAFKCHRSKEDGRELIHPVNAIAFHPTHSTFATGGSDALVNVWDPFNKKRLCQFHKYPAGVTSLDFSGDGSMLAIAASYNYEQGDDADVASETAIFIRKVTDQETRPKT